MIRARTRLKYLASVRAGTWGEEPGQSELDIYCVRAADFDRVRLRVLSDRLPVRSLDARSAAELKLTRGDLVLEKSGGGAGQPVGGTVLYDLDLPAVPSNFAARLRPASDVDPRFLLYLLAGLYYQGVTESLARQTTGIANLDVAAYMATEVAVPKLREQCAIADYLDAETARVDNVVAARRAQWELITARLEGQIWRATTKGLKGDRLHSTAAPWIGEMPKHWELRSVGAKFDVQLGKMLNPEAARGGEQFPYLRNLNVQWDRIDLSDLNEMHFDVADRRRYSLRAGDLIVCEGGEVGRSAIWDGALSPCFYQKALHRVRPRSGTNPRFLLYVLWAAAKRGVFDNEGNTSTIVHLTAEKLRAHRIPWPPALEQEEIVTALDEARAQARIAGDAIRRQIDLLLERRQALITAAVTGQLDVPGVAA